MGGKFHIGASVFEPTQEPSDLSFFSECIQHLPVKPYIRPDEQTLLQTKYALCYQREILFQNNSYLNAVELFLTKSIRNCIALYFYDNKGNRMLIHVDYKKNFDWEARLVSFDDNVYVIMAGGNTEDNTSLNNLINIIAYLGGISHKHGINFHFKEQFIIKTNKATHDDYKEFYIGRLNIQSELLTKNHFYRPFESKSSIQSQKPSPGIQSKLKMSAADLEAIMYELLSGNIRKVFACLPNLEDFYSLYNEYLLSDEVCENYLQDKADTLPQNSLIDFGFNCKDHSLVRIPLSFGVANKFSTRTLRLHDHLNNGYIEVFNGNENCKFIYVSSEIVNEFIKYLVNTNDITEIHINKGIGIKKLMGLYRKNLQNELFMPKPGKNKNYQTHQKTAEECANAGKKAYANNEYQTALEYYYKALKIVMKIHGEKHIEAAILFKNIANCYYQMGFYANALNFFHAACHIRSFYLQQNNDSLKEIYTRIRESWEKLNNSNPAQACIMHSIKKV